MRCDAVPSFLPELRTTVPEEDAEAAEQYCKADTRTPIDIDIDIDIVPSLSSLELLIPRPISLLFGSPQFGHFPAHGPLFFPLPFVFPCIIDSLLIRQTQSIVISLDRP